MREAIEKLEKIKAKRPNHCGLLWSEIDQVIALLRAEQPPAGDFTKLARKAIVCLSLAEADEKGNIKDEKGVESSIEVLFRACDCLDASEASRKELMEALEEIEAVSCGEKQIECDGAYDDSDGMQWIYKRIQGYREAIINRIQEKENESSRRRNK